MEKRWQLSFAFPWFPEYHLTMYCLALETSVAPHCLQNQMLVYHLGLLYLSTPISQCSLANQVHPLLPIYVGNLSFVPFLPPSALRSILSLFFFQEKHLIVAWGLGNQTKAWDVVRICQTNEERNIPVERYSNYIEVRDSMTNFGNNTALAPAIESELAGTLVTISCNLSPVKGSPFSNILNRCAVKLFVVSASLLFYKPTPFHSSSLDGTWELGPGISPLVGKFWFHHPQAMCPWLTYMTTLCLSGLTYKTGIMIIVSTLYNWCED